LNDRRCCIAAADEILRANRLSVKVPGIHFVEQNNCCVAENFRAVGNSDGDLRAAARFVADI
jgi:alpha/beta superfamily hydrolase